ncbi:MAG: hypothetical protein ABI595_14815, partial [Actinomycetota bacterium]
HERDDAVYVTARLVDTPDGSVLVPPSTGHSLARLGRRATKLGISVSEPSATAIDIDTGLVISIPPSLEVPDDALQRLAANFPSEGGETVGDMDVPGDVRAFLVPSRETEAPLQPARKGYALANLAGWTLNLEQVGGRGLEALGRFVERSSCYESAWTSGTELITRISALSKARP